MTCQMQEIETVMMVEIFNAFSSDHSESDTDISKACRRALDATEDSSKNCDEWFRAAVALMTA